MTGVDIRDRPADTDTDTTAAAGASTGASGRLRLLLRVVLLLAVLSGIAVRFLSRGDLWLDEALTVDIARLPPPQLLAALKVDGSPPLYYLLLHGWIDVFGAGTHAVRALSGVLSTLALAPAWWLGRRLGGRRLAVTTTVVLACLPFALRYGSETRMYALILLEVGLAGMALVWAAERPSPGRLSLLTVAVLALALTHYWSFFLLGAGALGLLALRRWRLLLAFVAAGVLFSPQLPTLWFQLHHTGTPWAPPTQTRAALDTLISWGGPSTDQVSAILGLLLVGLALLGALTVPGEGGRSLVVAPGRAVVGLRAAGLAAGPLVLAVAFTMIGRAGFGQRYTSVAVPAYCLLVALGLLRLSPAWSRRLLLVVAVAGLAVGTPDALKVRTEAGAVATALTAATGPGDVVVYCPDQLAPAVHRVLPPGRTEVSYGDTLGPSRVDWVDYRARNAALDPAALAETYDTLAGTGHSVAVVWAEGYRTLEGQCTELLAQLQRLRPSASQLVGRDDSGEPASLTIFAATAGLPSAGTGQDRG